MPNQSGRCRGERQHQRRDQGRSSPSRTRPSSSRRRRGSRSRRRSAAMSTPTRSSTSSRSTAPRRTRRASATGAGSERRPRRRCGGARRSRCRAGTSSLEPAAWTSSSSVRRRGLLGFLVDQAAARNAVIRAAQRASDEAWSSFTPTRRSRSIGSAKPGGRRPARAPSLEFAPKSNALRVRLGQQGLFTGTVKAQRGGAAEGRWNITARNKLGVRPAGDATAARLPWRYRVDGEGKVSVTFRVTSKACVALGHLGTRRLEPAATDHGHLLRGTGRTRASASRGRGRITFVRDNAYSGTGKAGYGVESVTYMSDL